MSLLKKRASLTVPMPSNDTARLPDDTAPVPAAGTRPVPHSSAPTMRRTAASSGQGLAPGTHLQGRYVIEGRIGMGGMSMVYQGRDLRFKDVVRRCAIKEMYQHTPDSQTRLLRLKNFEREAGLLATLSHSAIPKVYDFFEEQGKAYLIIELIDGHDLDAALRAAGSPFDEARVGRWALEVCDVLEYLHHLEPEPIIFRDLKPSNIIVTPQDRIVLIDFGIARVFQTDQPKGTIVGTEGYAPPEQYRGVVDARIDIYALGATLHHLLTGIDPRLETPFTFHERPVRQYNPAVSPAMEAIVMRAVAYDADERPATIAEMRTLLQNVPGVGRASRAAVPTAKFTVRQDGPQAKLRWKHACGEEVRSSAALRDNALYIGSYDTHLYCLDASTGDVRWKRKTDGGISSSPAIWADTVVIGSEDGVVYGLDANKGSLRWSFRTDRPVRSSPKVADRFVYVGSDDQHVYALDGRNGRQLWLYRTWMPVRSSCAIGNGVVYVGSSDNHVYALDALSGALRWKQRTQNGIISTPAVGQGVIYVGSMDGHLYALDAEAGSVVWRYKTGHYVNASPIVVGTRVLVGSVDGNMYAFDTRNGKVAWKYEAGAQITSSPRVSGKHVFFGGVNGVVYNLDVESGEPIWKFAATGPIVSSPAVNDTTVFVGSLDHHVYAIEI
jgi:eukaryotic-like serine/threonine-protein kinase